ncbi:SufI protein [Salmonella enterica subsp. arizonae]|uniref:SufI protein n=1 Tax=Salmonella enterica subsp. arizonae TaxID=59203 RepID=A0A379T524_SALER|nr:SufI protein [Salmonella enterica subsp. arizonae]
MATLRELTASFGMLIALILPAQQGTWERWTVRADMPQSFHIEGVSFLIRNVNGAMPFPEDRGWKDTVWVDGQVELLVYYGQPSWPALPVLFQQPDAGNGGSRFDWADAGKSGAVILFSPVRARGEYLSISPSFRLIIPGL